MRAVNTAAILSRVPSAKQIIVRGVRQPSVPLPSEARGRIIKATAAERPLLCGNVRREKRGFRNCILIF